MAVISFFEIEEWEKPFLQQNLQGHEVLFTTELLESGKKYDPKLFTCGILSTFAFSTLTAEVLQKFPNLKFITTRSTGYDHIDLAYCKERGVVVSNVPHYGVHTIAEHAFALLLALTRKIVQSVERTRKGDFSLGGLNGMQLFEKTIGVVGTGNIGSVVADIAMGMGMKVIAYNDHPSAELVAKGVTYLPFEELLKESDVVSLHLPLVDSTKHILNKQNILTMKKDAILINTARGGLVETEAILEGLEKGILAGVGLDVLEEECAMREERELLTQEFNKTCDLKTQLMDHMLLGREDVIITPHNAFHSTESLTQILETTATNIQGFLKGKGENVVAL